MIAVGTVVGLDILRIVLRFGFHVSSPMTIINVSWEGNLPTWFSTMLLAASALLLAVIAHVKIRQRDPYRWHWSVMALGFTMMSLDETAGFHEMLNGLLENYSLFKGRLAYPWVGAAMPFVGGVGITFLRFVWDLPARGRRRFVWAAAVYVGGAVLVEVLWSAYIVSHSRNLAASQLIRTLEEGMEMTGAAMFIVALSTYLAEELRSVSITITDQ